MSSLRQYQRRALEALLDVDGLIPFYVHREKDLDCPHFDHLRGEDAPIDEFNHGERIYLLGISTGEGTCADLHDANIAVFSRKKPLSSPRLPVGEKSILCRGAALLRRPSNEEFEEWIRDGWVGKCLVVEGINIIEVDDMNRCTRAYFVLTGRKESYPNII